MDLRPTDPDDAEGIGVPDYAGDLLALARGQIFVESAISMKLI